MSYGGRVVAQESDRERFPSLEDDIGEDPARFLDTSGVGESERGLVLARIRGIDFHETLNAWEAVERRLGGRKVILQAIEKRRAELEESGERDLSGIDLEAISARREREHDDVEPTWRHEKCGSTDVDQESSLTWFCNECEQRTNRVDEVDEEVAVA